MRWAVLAALLTASTSASCALATLDRTTLHGQPTLGLTVQDVPVRGYQVVAVITDADNVRGELLAVEEYSLWIETEEGRVVAVPRDTVDRVRVHVHASYGGAYAGWTVAGGASAFTHGWIALITVPIWAISGSINAGVEVGLSRGDARRAELDVLRQYARFPQGPPRALTGEPAPPRPQVPPPPATVPGATPAPLAAPPPALPPAPLNEPRPSEPPLGEPPLGETPLGEIPLDQIPPPPPAYGSPTPQRR